MAFVKYQSSEKVEPVKKDELTKTAATEKPKLYQVGPPPKA